jgi:hypothetical protein
MTCLEKLLLDHPEFEGVVEQKIDDCCPSDFGYSPVPEDCNSISCRTCWNREIPEEKKIVYAHIGPFGEPGIIIGDEKVEHPDTDTSMKFEEAIAKVGEVAANMGWNLDSMTPKILDSGNRTVFESGAVRDIQEGKGRCDLLPLDVVAGFLCEDKKPDQILSAIYLFQLDGDHRSLYSALDRFSERYFDDDKTLVLETAVHYEEGAKKYDENNWKKGIPVKRYIDSGVRHYLKFLRGDKDERHDRAFCWNMMGAIWTCKHMPELNEYRKTELGEACDRKVEAK